MPNPKCLENIAILCFERRFSKQKNVIRLKSNILPPQKFLAPQIFGLATPLLPNNSEMVCKQWRNYIFDPEGAKRC